MKNAFLKTHLFPLCPLDESGSQWLKDIEEQARKENLESLVSYFSAKGKQVDFISAVMTLSPFLREVLIANPSYLSPLLYVDIETRLSEIIDDVALIDKSESINETALMAALRRKKREAHILIALADLSGVFTYEISCTWLTRLGEAALGVALRFLLREAHDHGKISLSSRDNPEKDSGLIILGLGKLGAGELNYSSDIDLIVFIDEMSPHIGDLSESVDVFSKMVRRLIRIIQERTAEGYVFRLDFRLRPDPGSTPLALPVRTALRYYEGRGQNWERAAMIKARPVAGDKRAGFKFLKELFPYVWRKYLDYAAIADIHSIKRQIHACKNYGQITAYGHNIKLGRGGIREIEFFVQTQQLIAGGRFPQLRGRQTVAMLTELHTLGWISEKTSDNLIKSYAFLRNVEHRIQMLADEQTHLLPNDVSQFTSVAYLMGYQESSSFIRDLLKVLQVVEKHYAALFENEQELGLEIGNLVFTGEEDDPETLITLSCLGFERASDICRIMRTLHCGRYKATQSAEARERLTELTPALLKAFGAIKRADEAMLRFDSFLQGLPSGIQLFSLLQSNPSLLDMLVLIMGAAPRLAEIITRKPHVFDGMLDPTILSELPTKTYLENRLEYFLEGVIPYEEILDHLRVFADEQRFLIGIRILNGAITGEKAGFAFTALADLMIAKTLAAVQEEFSRIHGNIKGGRVGILGMGKLGSCELTAGSDVDLILVYEHDEDAEISDGEKPLYISQYYTRFTKRLIAALSTLTSQGVLYAVDLRLRPLGNKGPVAVSFEFFRKYYRKEAWIWEYLALTRARGIAGDPNFLQNLENEVCAIIALPHDKKDVAKAVREMRTLIEKEKPPENRWDLKMMSGGIMDVEFIAQFALITHVVAFQIGASTADILAHLPNSVLNQSCIVDLHRAYSLYTNLNQMIRLCLNDAFDPHDMPPGLSDLLLSSVGEPDLLRVEKLIEETAQSVCSIFKQIMKH
ncbi:bifunctional [glutamine synthetase] adenylyltransferase/[glutamine synthetase]-adenylyl-L-tyrosine phosphorylase [Bartonella quintana]|uniref:Bifunctional glutamine synthetase adenylyltransferase/adenylyl-removing enzyme n=1 Tax=Bartonella quintana (strain Toulouse) TaxID=283165 RepID=GLNE_BARQU|nr:bifunctional [glutamine synthetase] adenylyltransferase/[glutamine synthetase]-adenylyl-L-tyrosine phosphorylase [Bartonella quintana]Q6G0B0.1 RecName: Full=Bifunctional glutamine synthetase adenylyltransferase/adenylyl-removing enzyme; AltName: Full=ATP:glutamine synthetase adenylyltransferase; AltName: Full=ATase; Includes: RecName: Full=Glutamine synthetase adenylyl-L-tyrosine phosphorylase; AltName: Full=Adenylyl removase; Short=AR; Short=AT-N; Includes: RecName: Full=Glutamine synthetase a